MPRLSPFADVPPNKEGDFRFLLQKVYDAIVLEFEAHSGAVKGKIGEQEGKIKNLEAAVIDLQVCPCNKKHDHGKDCPLWIVEKEVLRNKWNTRGIYIGVFTSGACCFYLAQLAIAFFIRGH